MSETINLVATIVGWRVEIIPDSDPDLSYLEQDCFNEVTDGRGSVNYGHNRIAAYHAGEWEMVGVCAVVTLEIGNEQVDISSCGLWGIESDGGEEYFAEIYNREREELLFQLTKGKS